VKHVPFFLIIILVAMPVFSQNPEKQKNPEPRTQAFKVTWVDFAFNNYVPIPDTRFADFSKINFGGSIGVNFMVANVRPLWLFINLMTDYNLSNTKRMDRLIDMGASLGLGWRFSLVKERFYFTPRVSYGYMLHYSYGNYFNDQRIYVIGLNSLKKRSFYFSDQYLEYGLEFAVDVTPPSGRTKCELFLTPEFIHFIEKRRQGLEAGYKIGFRINVESDGAAPAAMEIKVAQPTILAGRAVDAETGRALPLAAVTITGGKASKTDPAPGEYFAFTVDPEKDYVLNAEFDGYEPAARDMKRDAINSGKRNPADILMKLSRKWGIFGHVFEKESNDPLGNVEVLVTDAAGGRSVMNTDRKGDFRMELKPNTDYEVMLKKRRYFTVRGSFSTKGRMPGWFDVKKFMRTEFQKVVVGATVEFGSIHYDSGSWYIRPDVVPALDKIVQFLSDNPTIVVELGAHTDSMGDAGQNMVLSQKRAQSAVDYLIKKGIKTERISARGYGETKIKNRCVKGVACSGMEHQENRRTEIKVMKITRE